MKATKESCQMYDLTSTSNATRAGSMDHETLATSLSPGTDVLLPSSGAQLPMVISNVSIAQGNTQKMLETVG